MNLQHLRYMTEVERVGSITKAAANLFMGQPNLSKAIKEVENEVGVQIFRRSAKGVIPTEKGAEFLEYAHAILVQADKIDGLREKDKSNRISFSISVPRATYISHAFTKFVIKLEHEESMEINFRETNSIEAINDVAEGVCNLAVIRFDTAYEEYFLSLLREKDMAHELVLKFRYYLLMSEKNPLAEYDDVPESKLREMTEILHGDLSVPYIAPTYTRKNSGVYRPKKIFVYERGSQFDLLKGVHGTFMWVSPMPSEFMEGSGLTVRKCSENPKIYKDLLVRRAAYTLSEADIGFLDELKLVTDEIGC